MRYPSKKQFISKIKKLDPCRSGLKRLQSKLRHNTVRETLNQYLNNSFDVGCPLEGYIDRRIGDMFWLLGQLAFFYIERDDHRNGLRKIHADDVIRSLHYWTRQ